ncbi:MAG: heat-shock protein Hsp20 [Gammaproteobacteria bacterium SG8_31]|jgi:HSP20 family protein|nr:MAG: heat-shock protein Hsp20 [Gammaproteobacteria bacterium SG8_31]
MLVRYDPWSLVNRLQGDLDRLAGQSPRFLDDDTAGATTDWVPAVDIKEEDARFLIEADVPGVRPDDIEITMENGVLTLRGKRASESRTERDGYRRVERVTGRFFRRFTLPDTADAEAIEAKFNNGVLEVSIPKLPKVQPRRINVQVS